jgi:hypothetical protein
LTLHSVNLKALSSGWGFLSALTALQQLDLRQTPPCISTSADVACNSKLGEAFTGLVGLKQLRLEWQFNKNIKLALGMLTQLKDLRLHPYENARWCLHEEGPAAAASRPASRLNLPHSLTHLVVQIPQHYSSTLTPDLASLTGLQHLQSERASHLDAQLLSCLAHLTHLQLSMKRSAITKSSTSHLLDVLPCNAQLQHLQLEFLDPYNTGDFIRVNSRQCSSLTSHSHPTSLQLSGVQLPRSCGKLLFPAGGTLLHLTKIQLRGMIKWKWDSQRDQYVFDAPTPPIGPAGDLYRLVECCPNLEDLDLAGSLQCGVDMSPLRHLRHLTSLVVGGPSVDDRCAARLGQLTGLRTLTVVDPGCKGEPDEAGGKVYKPKRQLRPYISWQCSARCWLWTL